MSRRVGSASAEKTRESASAMCSTVRLNTGCRDRLSTLQVEYEARTLEEALVEAVVAGDLGVERGAEQIALLDGDDAAVAQRRERRRRRPDRLDDRARG